MADNAALANRRVTQDGRFRVGFFLRKIYQKNQKIWLAHCPDPSLTSVQAGVLTVLLNAGSCSLSELGAAAAIDLSTVRGVTERLRRRKLVSLRKDKDDARKVIVHLEPSGREKILELIPIMRVIADATLHPLNPAERIALEYLIQKLIADEDDAPAEIAPSETG